MGFNLALGRSEKCSRQIPRAEGDSAFEPSSYSSNRECVVFVVVDRRTDDVHIGRTAMAKRCQDQRSTFTWCLGSPGGPRRTGVMVSMWLVRFNAKIQGPRC